MSNTQESVWLIITGFHLFLLENLLTETAIVQSMNFDKSTDQHSYVSRRQSFRFQIRLCHIESTHTMKTGDRGTRDWYLWQVRCTPPNCSWTSISLESPSIKILSPSPPSKKKNALCWMDAQTIVRIEKKGVKLERIFRRDFQASPITHLINSIVWFPSYIRMYYLSFWLGMCACGILTIIISAYHNARSHLEMRTGSQILLNRQTSSCHYFIWFNPLFLSSPTALSAYSTSDTQSPYLFKWTRTPLIRITYAHIFSVFGS